MIIFYLGLILFIVGGIGILIAALRTSLLWGLGCLLFWPVSIAFIALHWSEAKNPFFLQLAALFIIFMSTAN
ncbi:hypothetical protein [uncultured Acinetobacter sp.]|uniref:hypothetical protein n=1 Tax=uncultured Acinetobacter sp. TaxID=165433 RepID=UPI00260F1D96|nr:hypothetical protein [uncultured Acinetobacter sp.]